MFDNEKVTPVSPENVPDEILVNLPPSLRCPTLRNGVGIGLHYIACGSNPQKLPEIKNKKNWKTTRIPLTGRRAKACYAQLVGRPDFPAKVDPILFALAWVAEQPPHVRNIQID